MKNLKLEVTLFSAAMLMAISGAVNAQALACGAQSAKTGQIYKVNGSEVYIQKSPGSGGERLINEKATAVLGTTKYLQIDNSTTVREECSEDGWSRVAVTDPDWLRDSHIGWVPSSALRGRVVDQAGKEVFTEADFLWDQTIEPYKEIIIAGVNKVHRENSRCTAIDASSAYISSSRGTPADPVFFVTCGEGFNAFNVFFSKSEVEANSAMRAVPHIDRALAIQLCEEHAKSSATHPSTVEFSKFLDLAVSEHPNGNTTVASTFSAKNSFNLELKYNIRCLVNALGLFEGNINEAQ